MAKGGAGKSKQRKAHRGARASNASSGSALSGASSSREARRNASQQQVKHKRGVLVAQRRAASSARAPPRVVAVVAAGASADAAALAATLLGHSVVAPPADGATCVLARQRLTVLQPPREVHAVLDAMKVADVLLLAIPADGGLDELGERLVDAACMQGVGSVVGVLQGVGALPPKQQPVARREWAASLAARFPEHSRFFGDDSEAASAQLVRHLVEATPRPVSWRAVRPHVLAHSYEYTAGADGADGTLRLCGYVRGQPLGADALVHVPGVGDCALRRVGLDADPNVGGGGGAAESMSVEGAAAARELVPDAARAMDRRYLAEADSLMGEQTWPTDAELSEADASTRRGGPRQVRVADGLGGSEYAREWEIPEGDDGEEGEGEEEEEAGGDAAMTVEAAARAAGGGEGEGDDDDDEDGDVVAMDDAAEAEARQELLRQRSQRDEDVRFPDEVDTPLDTPARTRFARYRGLASFRSSPWHPKENLPTEYAQIYQFEDWPATQRHAEREARARALAAPDAVAEVGCWVALDIAVPADAAAAAAAVLGGGGSLGGGGAPLVVAALNEHENRMSVVHFTISLTATAEQSETALRSKQPLLFRCGFRTFSAAPIFSEDTRRADKHKLERFLQPGRQSVATVYAPALCAPAPLLAFLPDGAPAAAEHPLLREAPVASGALLSVDPDRIVLKKIVLTGHPFRCHKKKAVVRWMFFSPEDIRWFKPIELTTKFGRKGHIRESLGTHGYMKCIFDNSMMQHDTVCMNLYKRAYPKMTFSWS